MNDLLKTFGPDALGIYWGSRELMSNLRDENGPLFQALNYFTDGLFSNQTNHQEQRSRHFFVTKNFQQDFLVMVELKEMTESSLEFLRSYLKGRPTDRRSQFYFWHNPKFPLKKETLAKLGEQFPHIDFLILD